MSKITTHVLDTSVGKPGVGIPIVLEAINNGETLKIGEGVTNNDGRVSDLLPKEKTLEKGVYRITFDTGAYFKKKNSKYYIVFYVFV